MTTHYSIGQFAQKCGLSVDTLRYYEKEAIVQSHRKENGHRYYTESDLEWAQFIVRLKHTGMSIKHIAEYAELRRQGDSTIPKRLQLLFAQKNALHAKQQELADHLAFLEQKISLYQTMSRTKQ